MSTPQAVLAQPLTLPNGSVLRNRIAKSAMSEGLGDRHNSPTERLPALYGRWAEGGLGLCITGNVMIDRRALGEPGNVAIEDDRDLVMLRAWAEAGTRHGTQLWMQINHPGKQAPKGLNRENVSPSAVPFKPELAAMFAPPRELTGAEIDDLIVRFGRAAGVAKAAGFSGVQIHAAHGYLISQFLSPHHNRRTDRWGGSAENRRRFVLAVLAEMRRNVGAGFPIGIKLNSADFQRGGFTEEESLDTIRALVADGIDLIEISGGNYEAPAMAGTEPMRESTRQREAYFLEFAEKARAAVPVPLMLTGGFRTLKGMAAAVESGAVDIVGLARPLAIEPDIPARLLQGFDPRHAIRPRNTGIKAVDRTALMEVMWYERQLHRMGEGGDPIPDESVIKLFLRYLWQNGVQTFRRRRATA